MFSVLHTRGIRGDKSCRSEKTTESGKREGETEKRTNLGTGRKDKRDPVPVQGQLGVKRLPRFTLKAFQNARRFACEERLHLRRRKPLARDRFPNHESAPLFPPRTAPPLRVFADLPLMADGARTPIRDGWGHGACRVLSGRVDHLLGELTNVGQEMARIFRSLRNRFEAGFPRTGQIGRLKRLGEDLEQLAGLVRRDQAFFLPAHIVASQQHFQNAGPRRRRAQAIFFHQRKQPRVGEPGRRGRFLGVDRRVHDGHRIARLEAGRQDRRGFLIRGLVGIFPVFSVCVIVPGILGFPKAPALSVYVVK